MTRLLIDKREVAPLPSHLHSLEQVVKLVETNHLSPNTIIRDIRIDGQPLAGADEEFALPASLDQSATIEIFTSSVGDVALDSIREALVYLDRVAKATPLLAAGFRTQCGRQEFENLKQFYEGFYWINLLLDRLERSFDLRLETISVNGMSAHQHHIHLAALLKDVIGAHERKDFGLVADLLEYEIAPLIPSCKDLFAAVRQAVLERA